MRLIALRVVMNRLKNVENYQKLGNCLSPKNCLSQENRKAKKRLSLEIWLSQKKSCQKVGIQLISTLRKIDQSF